ncbi:hypothetical protein [Dehalococcoides mccartyi]|jgi:DNA-binding XRE family transcriptional regulator|uniref:hypothetical protein n=1 Tax=Dehalococcoides mccartyi TaxID=61435 RepID=UPI0026F22E59|nr:hypothetical protein [Dehalococcoides mccartyi]
MDITQERVKPIHLTSVGAAMMEIDCFKDDIELILAHWKRSTSALAKPAGVHRNTLINWRRGRCLPRDPLAYVVIKECASDIRKSLGQQHLQS